MSQDSHERGLVERQIQAIDRFPDQNPNPVLRVALDGELTYANLSSEPIRRALGAEVGDAVPAQLMDRLRTAAESGASIELHDGVRTFAVLPVVVQDLGFINLYGSDITAEKVVERFPNQNPNPVFRVDEAGKLVYVNAASRPLIEAFGLEVGDSWPMEIAQRVLAAADTANELIEIEADLRTYALRPVRIPEFGFINVYGTDITAEKVVAKFPGQNPNPVLRTDSSGILTYANEASAPMRAALNFAVGEPLPVDLSAQINARVEAASREPIECVAGEQFYELTAVEIPEFGFINLYGTDVTAARQVARAKEETERLLLNILPAPIADRLRSGEKVIADRFEDASLLMADIVDFTELSSGLSADELVELLNDIFSMCDVLVERYDLEKVKTIGDAYMVIGGVPTASDDHLERLADFALDMALAVKEMQTGQEHPIRVRIGINCGPVVAGVIGTKRTIYDVWGDTVNMASRMESLSEPGRIQVTPIVYERLKGTFDFAPRGQIEVKGKGPMTTWWLTGRITPRK
ncbi:MAG: adenylate/guanylate cyclase domain-containing protein [Chloroflexota bacterium]